MWQAAQIGCVVSVPEGFQNWTQHGPEQFPAWSRRLDYPTLHFLWFSASYHTEEACSLCWPYGRLLGFRKWGVVSAALSNDQCIVKVAKDPDRFLSSLVTESHTEPCLIYYFLASSMLKDEDLTEMVQTFVALRSSLRHMKWELAKSPSEANSATWVSCSGTEAGTRMLFVAVVVSQSSGWHLQGLVPHCAAWHNTFPTLQSLKLTPQDAPSRAEGLQGPVLCQGTPKIWHLNGSIGRVFKGHPAAKVLDDCVWYTLGYTSRFSWYSRVFLSLALFSLLCFPSFIFHLCKQTRNSINSNSFSKIVALAKRAIFKETWQQNKHGKE